MEVTSTNKLRIFTIGHSTRSFEQFASLLKEFRVETVADIRRYPGSRKFPHFNGPVLRELLKAEDIEYVWLQGLGGRRNKPTSGPSPNTGLKTLGFRYYADYMATDEFRAAVEELLSTEGMSQTAVMCAEKLYWRCHRRLLSDYLTARGAAVEHIVEAGRLQPHRLTAGAVITPRLSSSQPAELTVVYPAQPSEASSGQGLFQS
jgi:uncharacterized protein (DUF488 family)